MNKSQELAVMQLRAKKKVEEMLAKHDQRWNGTEPIRVKPEKKDE